MRLLRWVSLGLLGFLGTTLRAILVVATIGGLVAYANYTMTQGSGTTFGSIIVGGVHYAQQFICDLTTPTQCMAVDNTGAIKVQLNPNGQAVMASSAPVAIASNQSAVPISAASLPLPTGAMGATGGTVGIVAGTALIGKVGIDQTTPGTTNGVALVGVNGATALAGAGAVGTGSPRVAVGQDSTTIAGSAPVKGGVGVVNGGSFYQAVAASATATVLQSSTGAIGDYLSHCVLYPTSTSPGVVTVFDNANAAATNVIAFPGGASSLSNLVPFAMPVGAVSVAGAWKVTTGASISVVCYGKFS